MKSESLWLDAASEDRSLRHALLSEEAYVLGVFGRTGASATRRVLDGLSGRSDETGGQEVFSRGGLVPARTLRFRVAAELARRGRDIEGSPSWSDLVRSAGSTPGQVLVFDEAHLVEEADRRFLRELARGWKASVAEGGVPRIVLVSDDGRFIGRATTDASPFYDPLVALTQDQAGPVATAEIGLLPYGTLARACSAWSAIDVIRGYAVFGGQPDVLRWVEPDRSLGWNVTRLLLDPSGPLFGSLPAAISTRFQKTGRYGAVLSALAGGARSWPELVRSTPEFGSGSPMGAYMKRLEERGFVVVRDPLDALPGSRRKRYAVADACDAFWFRFVAPLFDRILAGRLESSAAWESWVLPEIDDYVRQILPEVGRQYLERYALERLGSQARITGGLWGEGHDFEVAATLRDGSVVYGHSTWVGRQLGEDALLRAREELRETRFGFGRERRTVLLIMREPPAPELEHAALRDPNVEWVDAERLVSAARSAKPGSEP